MFYLTMHSTHFICGSVNVANVCCHLGIYQNPTKAVVGVGGMGEADKQITILSVNWN